MKLIDLSVPINNQTPNFPGDPQIKITQAGVLEKDGYQDHAIYLSNHAGTHIDAPSHMVVGGKSLNEFPIDKFSGRGVYIKVNKHFDLSEIESADIRQGDIVLFHTGIADMYYQSDYFTKYLVMDQKVAKYLVKKRVKMVGFDTCSADKDKSFPVHKTLLKSEVLIIENLTNLAEVDGKRFKVYALPLKLEVDGAPARIVAEILS